MNSNACGAGVVKVTISISRVNNVNFLLRTSIHNQENSLQDFIN